MDKPKSVPENIWEAVRIVADALQRKNEISLAIPAVKRFSNATSNQTVTGGYDAGQTDCITPAGKSEPDGFE